jgi:putative spermidine/putrescine transport system substrate-binding protein
MRPTWSVWLAILCMVCVVGCSTAGQSVAQADPAKQPWEQVVAQARGTTVNLHMWGGDENINRYINEYVAGRLKTEYDVTLVQTPLGDTAEAVNKLLNEQTAGKQAKGSIDLLWINGENYRTLRQGNLLYGSWARTLPNASVVSWDEPSVANDFGQPVEDYEAPWGRAQFVLIYDSARTSNPPRTFADLLAWAEANPGRFTYPAIPDFTGSAFVRHLFYALEANEGVLDDGWSEASYTRAAPPVWDYLRQLRPHMWRGGETLPQSVEQLNTLFAGGEVDVTLSYNPAFADGAISRGTFPPTTRTYLLESGTLANTHYLAIPFNATNKAGAMVAANFTQSVEAQIEKAKPEVWGDLPVLDAAQLSADDRAALDAVPRGEATLPAAELAANTLPEPGAEWVDRIEADWQREVLAQP